MGLFERFLSVWVAIAISVGLLAGYLFPSYFVVIAEFEFAHINLVIAVLIWLMIFPMMLQIDFTSVRNVLDKPKGIALTLIINWLIKPFTMALLAWFFFTVLFADLVDPQSASEYIAGMILLGVAPCTAMVFVWSQLVRGDANYTLVQVSANDIIMIFAFAPITGYLLGVTDIEIPWSTLGLSILLYVVLPLLLASLLRTYIVNYRTTADLQATLVNLKPFSVIGLLATVFILFALQAKAVIAQPLTIVLIAIPLLLQTYGIFALSYVFAKKLKLPHNIAAPACLIGTSNFFELAVAVAIALFGLHSAAALATVVGVLVEVPVMLSLVWFANKTRAWFD